MLLEKTIKKRNIYEIYKINDSRSYGRYLKRTVNSWDSSKDTGYKIKGVDFNRLDICIKCCKYVRHVKWCTIVQSTIG